MDVEPTLLAEPSADDVDSLVSSNAPDDMANEQTWPTEEEMQGASGAGADGAIPDAKIGTTPKRVKKVPKGTSEYQAAWIVDDDDEEGVDEDGEGDEETRGEEAEMAEEEEEMVDMAEEDMETDGGKNVAFEDLDMEEETRQYVSVLVRALIVID